MVKKRERFVDDSGSCSGPVETYGGICEGGHGVESPSHQNDEAVDKDRGGMGSKGGPEMIDGM